MARNVSGFKLKLSPTKQKRIFEFLKKDPDFMELMKTKEKQGLTKLIIAPAPGSYSLKDFGENICLKVMECGGVETKYTETWQNMSADEDQTRYFGAIDTFDLKPTGGVTAKEIKTNPDKYGICDGWLISFTTDEQNIARGSDPNKDTGDGRIAIKTSLRAADYIEKYFSGKDETYQGEEAMIPQEHLALFAKDLFENYVKTGNKIMTPPKSYYLLDSAGVTWFVSTYLPGATALAAAGWGRNSCRFYYSDYSSAAYYDDLGVRSVVRRKLK